MHRAHVGSRELSRQVDGGDPEKKRRTIQKHLSGERQIGKVWAERYERALGLPEGYFPPPKRRLQRRLDEVEAELRRTRREARRRADE